MLPVRCIIVELNDGSLFDLNWVKENAQKNTLITVKNSQKSPNAIIVKIINKTESSFMIKDDTINEPIELLLKTQELDYLKLLDESDIIMVWKPVVYQNPFVISLSSESVIFRAPVPNIGRNQREIMKCGVVDSVGHFTSGNEWMGCQIDIITKGAQRIAILFSNQTSYYYKKILSTLRIGHFSYFFHLVALNEKTFKFSRDSTVYNLNIIPSFLDSMIARPIPIKQIFEYTSAIVRAVILKIDIQTANIHIDCGCQVNDDNFCQRCQSNSNGRIKKVILNKVTIEDGSESLTIYGFSSDFNLIGFDASEWELFSQKVKTEIINHFIGQEYVFFLTRSDYRDFNINEKEKKSDFIWRVDTFSEGKEETKRVARCLIDHLNSNSTQDYQVGFCGNSPFFFSPS